MKDIGIKGAIRFSVRCAALFISGNKILIHKKRRDKFYTLPGGKCRLGEDSRHAVEREILEELNVKLTMKRMVVIGENFFRFQNRKHHELLFIYQATERSTRQLMKMIPDKRSVGNLTFEWVSISNLKNIRLNPLFLSELVTKNTRKPFVNSAHASNYIP